MIKNLQWTLVLLSQNASVRKHTLITNFVFSLRSVFNISPLQYADSLRQNEQTKKKRKNFVTNKLSVCHFSKCNHSVCDTSLDLLHRMFGNKKHFTARTFSCFLIFFFLLFAPL